MKERTESRIKDIAEALHIRDILRKFPYEVSGGQKLDIQSQIGGEDIYAE